MPFCFMYTNIKAATFPPDFEKLLNERLREMFCKPKNERMHMIIQSDLNFCRNNTYEPAILLEIRAFDVFDASTTPKFSKSLTDYLSSNLTVPRDRITLQYVPIDKSMVGIGF